LTVTGPEHQPRPSGRRAIRSPPAGARRPSLRPFQLPSSLPFL